MLQRLRSLLNASPQAEGAGDLDEHPPDTVLVEHELRFDLWAHRLVHEGLPHLNWSAVTDWVQSLPAPALKAQGWNACEKAWLAHLRAALGKSYFTASQADALLLSSLDPSVARATLEFMLRTRQRIVRILDGLTEVPEWGHDVLLVFDDQETYYRYVSHFYPADGEFAFSGGMFIDAGCSHFATTKADLHVVEPVIAHETTHALLSHLPLPAWLNEGIAVNTEHRLCPPLRDPRGLGQTPWQMRERHRAFWNAQTLQEFWSGKSFLRPDEGNELSYDLARILVEQLGRDWESFRRFARAAQAADAGQDAARVHLNLSLGDAMAALLDLPSQAAPAPDPKTWSAAPERGGFGVSSESRSS